MASDGNAFPDPGLQRKPLPTSLLPHMASNVGADETGVPDAEIEDNTSQSLLPDNSLSAAEEPLSSRNQLARTRPTWSRQFGWLALTVLLGGLAVVLASVIFLTWLWFTDSNNHTWQQIMLNNWATRSVTLTALAMRTAISLQAGVATAMLSALILERFAVRIQDAAQISTMRAGLPHPFGLAELIIPAWKQRSSKRITILVATLVVTTVLLQFASTALLADLGPHSISSTNFTTAAAPAYNFMSDWARNFTDFNPAMTSRSSTWTRKPFQYPTFAEYSEAPVVQTGVVDTGLTLRAFLPIGSLQERENLRSFSGKTAVLDARVTCQAPTLRNESLYLVDSDLTFTGQVWASQTTPRLDNNTFNLGIEGEEPLLALTPSDGVYFGCLAQFAGFNDDEDAGFNPLHVKAPMSICQLAEFSADSDDLMSRAGGLVPEFMEIPRDADKRNQDSLPYNAAYLVMNLTSSDLYRWSNAILGPDDSDESGDGDSINGVYFASQDSKQLYVHPLDRSARNEWIDLKYSSKNDPEQLDLTFSVSICYASYDTADLDIQMHSARNRTEPSSQYDPTKASYTFNDVRAQLGQTNNASDLDSRGILALEMKESWFSDFSLNGTATFRSWLQSTADMVGRITPGQNSGQLYNSTRLGNMGNFSAALYDIGSGNGDPTQTYFTNVNYTTPDTMQIQLFQEVIADGGNIAFALQSLITVFASMDYYDQFPQFDARSNQTTTSFVVVQTPGGHTGYAVVMTVLIVHLVTVLFVVAWFAHSSRFTMLGNAWHSIAQVASYELHDVLGEATMTSDDQFKQLLAKRGEKSLIVGVGRIDETSGVGLRRVNRARENSKETIEDSKA